MIHAYHNFDKCMNVCMFMSMCLVFVISIYNYLGSYFNLILETKKICIIQATYFESL